MGTHANPSPRKPRNLQQRSARSTARLLTLVLFTMASCAVEEPSQVDTDEEFSIADEELGEGPSETDDEGAIIEKGFLKRTEQSNAEIFTWSKGQRDQYMKPTATHTCFLTRISGAMDAITGTLPAVSVHRSSVDGAAVLFDGFPSGSGDQFFDHWILDDVGDTWKLMGFSEARNSLTAEATCVPNADFVLAPGAVLWNSPRFSSVVRAPGTAVSPMWWGNAVSYLAEVAGDFNGGGEVAEILYNGWDRPTSLGIMTQSVLFGDAAGYSLFIGVPDRPGTVRTTAVKQSGNKKKNLIRTAEGVCFLTRISGDFRGSEERVRLMPTKDSSGVEWWTFETHAGSGSASATAQCVPYFQISECSGC